jgi:hypothetical protein
MEKNSNGKNPFFKIFFQIEKKFHEKSMENQHFVLE